VGCGRERRGERGVPVVVERRGERREERRERRERERRERGHSEVVVGNSWSG